MTDQVRKSSGSICTIIAEAYRKKIFPAHFVYKATDSDAEKPDSGIWFDLLKNFFMPLEENIKKQSINEITERRLLLCSQIST